MKACNSVANNLNLKALDSRPTFIRGDVKSSEEPPSSFMPYQESHKTEQFSTDYLNSWQEYRESIRKRISQKTTLSQGKRNQPSCLSEEFVSSFSKEHADLGQSQSLSYLHRQGADKQKPAPQAPRQEVVTQQRSFNKTSNLSKLGGKQRLSDFCSSNGVSRSKRNSREQAQSITELSTEHIANSSLNIRKSSKENRVEYLKEKFLSYNLSQPHLLQKKEKPVIQRIRDKLNENKLIENKSPAPFSPSMQSESTQFSKTQIQRKLQFTEKSDGFPVPFYMEPNMTHFQSKSKESRIPSQMTFYHQESKGL